MERLLLQNDLLHVRFLPGFGAKIPSLRRVRTEEEFLLPPLSGYRRVSPSDGFNESDGGGFDECLPSVASCEAIAGALPVPDHGDLWRLKWRGISKAAAAVLYSGRRSPAFRLATQCTLGR